ncbi:MAG: DUF2752 domain-containing protein [Ruminococcus sp.]|nr:DUF2752 domain-containing protein [Ruminococcus sp.]
MKQYTKLQKTIFILLPFILFPLGILLGKFLSNYTYLLPPCMSYTLFHFNCPGCGLTRSVLALLDGDILLSLRQNVIPVFSILAGLWLYVEFLFHVFNKKPPFTLLKTKCLWVLLVALGAYTILRNIFPVLAPV